MPGACVQSEAWQHSQRQAVTHFLFLTKHSATFYEQNIMSKQENYSWSCSDYRLLDVHPQHNSTAESLVSAAALNAITLARLLQDCLCRAASDLFISTYK